MINLTTLEWAQLTLIGTGIVLVLLGPVIGIMRVKSQLRPLWMAGRKAVPASTFVSTAAYRPVPVHATPGRVSQSVVRAGQLKETAKMAVIQACRSSQRLLSAVQKELVPKPISAPESSAG